MNIISPLTLLIVPLIGSLIIVSYPYLTDKDTFPLSFAYKSRPAYASSYTAVPSALQEEAIVRTTALAEDKKLSEALALPGALKQIPLSLAQAKTNSSLKKIAIITSLVNFIISIILWIQFDSSYVGYQFVTDSSSFVYGAGAAPTTGLEFIQLNLGVDGISLFFVLLTTFITPVALLSSHNDIEKNLKFYLVSILLLETLQIAVFVVLDLLLFYIFFESVLIPLFFIVGV